MRRANIVSLTMGSAMLISAAAAMAGPPTGITYGGFSATSGTISAACPGTYTCGAAITGNGFFQRALTNSGGTTFYQTIVLPTGAAVTGGVTSGLAFADENFVQQGGGTGIADQSTLFQLGTTSNPGDFTASTQINSGWAQGAWRPLRISIFRPL